jgi:asparagine synthase (glutamine-hydrolysing)
MLVDRLREVLLDVVEGAIVDKGSIAIAYSGGLDSTLLATICKSKGIDITLLTIGFPQSHDIWFSKQVASRLDLNHRISILEEIDFHKNLGDVLKKINCEKISHIENCIAFFYISKLARESNHETVLSANGCDELFCGYDIYRRVYDEGKTRLMQLIEEKILNEFKLLEEINMVASEFGVKIRQPFLSNKLIAFSRDVPINEKIFSSKDYLRKQILRQVASLLNVPSESAFKQKKALQYGTEIHRRVKKYLK